MVTSDVLKLLKNTNINARQIFLTAGISPTRQENTNINAQENESRYSDIFVLILVALFQKRPKAAFLKIKTTRRVALFLSAFSRLAAAGSLKNLASMKASVSFPGLCCLFLSHGF